MLDCFIIVETILLLTQFFLFKSPLHDLMEIKLLKLFSTVCLCSQDYFYHNISNTPFTLGIVVPNKYGKYRVNGGLEVNDPQNRKDGNGRKYLLGFFPP